MGSVDPVCDRIIFPAKSGDPDDVTRPSWTPDQITLIGKRWPLFKWRVTGLRADPTLVWDIASASTTHGLDRQMIWNVITKIGDAKTIQKDNWEIKELSQFCYALEYFHIPPSRFPLQWTAVKCKEFEKVRSNGSIEAISQPGTAAPAENIVPLSQRCHSSGSIHDLNWAWNLPACRSSADNALHLAIIALSLGWTTVFKQEISTVIWAWRGTEATVQSTLPCLNTEALKRRRRTELRELMHYLHDVLEKKKSGRKQEARVRRIDELLGNNNIDVHTAEESEYQDSIYGFLGEIQRHLLERPQSSSATTPADSGTSTPMPQPIPRPNQARQAPHPPPEQQGGGNSNSNGGNGRHHRGANSRAHGTSKLLRGGGQGGSLAARFVLSAWIRKHKQADLAEQRTLAKQILQDTNAWLERRQAALAEEMVREREEASRTLTWEWLDTFLPLTSPSAAGGEVGRHEKGKGKEMAPGDAEAALDNQEQSDE